MARQITKKRGKSSIKTRLEQERKAGRKDPKGKKSVVSKAAIASLAIPGSAAVKVGAKAAKVAKAAKAAKEAAKKTREAERKAKGIKSQKNIKDTRQYAADRKLEKAVTNKKPFTTTSRPSTKDKFKKDGSLRIDKAAKEKKAVDKYRKREAIERAGTMADGERGPMTLSNKKAILKDLKKKDKANISTTTDKKIVDTKELKRLMKKKIVLRRMARQEAKQKRDNLEKVFTKKSRKNMKPSGSTRKRRMEEGGLVKKHRSDGIAKRGRTRGRIV